MRSVRPQLLVSVRNVDEALAAQRGLSDIIDVKEPLKGSLGRADAEVIGRIHRALSEPRLAASVNGHAAIPAMGGGQSRPATCLSLALGEVLDWRAYGGALVHDYRVMIRAVRPAYLKLGLAGLANRSTLASMGIADWEEAWTAVKALFSGDHEWVAVAYADNERADSPNPLAVCDAAVASQCRVLLLDTFLKDNTTLLDWQSSGELRELRKRTQQHGMLLALAGRVSREVAVELLPIDPDIVGVRGAVCLDGERTSVIDEHRIELLRTALSGG